MIEVLLLAILFELTAIAWILHRELSRIADALTSDQKTASTRASIERLQDPLSAADILG